MSASPIEGRILAISGSFPQALSWATAVLSWSGYRIDRADTPDAALRLIQSTLYDVILLGYNSGEEDIRLAAELIQEPEARIQTLVLITQGEEFITPPQTHYVPTAFLEPGFTQEELLRMVQKLRQFKQ